MKLSIVALLTVTSFVPVRSVLSHTATSRGSGRNTHPIENVISLLKELRQQVFTEGQDEEVTYAKFAKWCQDSGRTLQRAVQASKDSIDSLQNEVEGKTAENATLTEQLAKLAEEISKYEGSDTESEQARTAENQRYTTADQDFASTIQAFEDAIQALQDAQPSSGAALVQELLSRFPPLALGLLSDNQASLLMEAASNSSDGNSGDERPDLLAQGDYGKHTKKYTFKSGNIIELLKQLKASFEDQRVEATKAETNAVNAYNLAKDARDRALQAARTAHSEKTSALGNCQSALSSAEGALSDAEGDLGADSSALADTKRQCNMKKMDWEERSSIRAKEIAAIDAGVKVLAKVTGVRTEAPSNPGMPAPPADAPSANFMQEAAILSLQTDPRARAITLLKSEAMRLQSKAFQRFASEVEAKVAGHFDEVDNMIQKMIFRLMAEQKDEDDHKNWCDLEMDKTNASLQNKEDKLTELGLKIDAAKSSVAELTQQIQDASGMVAQIDGFIQEATAIRNTGKKENAAAIKDAKAAQQSIAKAIAVLEEFYKENGMIAKEAWEFMQRGSDPVTLPENPALWDSPYTGAADPKNQENGIIAILERIASDFSTMQAATMAQEATDEKNYQEEVQAQQIEKARRSKEAEMKTQEKQRLQEKVASLEKSKKHTQQEKAATDQYLKDLEPACIDGDSTYEERKSARDDEIQALKEAQVILADAFKDVSPGKSFLAPVRS